MRRQTGYAPGSSGHGCSQGRLGVAARLQAVRICAQRRGSGARRRRSDLVVSVEGLTPGGGDRFPSTEDENPTVVGCCFGSCGVGVSQLSSSTTAQECRKLSSGTLASRRRGCGGGLIAAGGARPSAQGWHSQQRASQRQVRYWCFLMVVVVCV
ncbi:putative serine/arginine-rich splicing factor SR45 isoform X2 [Iris pallida]|uniref:Serine/arginine-rich splicing factor SR45 isoform X2 n=1 Tax=Iris pallida TaxID=29817 RepID=A0AAX6H1P6_IRIPA|nr:putative serine/arginine-rich splicing factor SR45 isoform X2 [Iris pallida]